MSKHDISGRGQQTRATRHQERMAALAKHYDRYADDSSADIDEAFELVFPGDPNSPNLDDYDPALAEAFAKALSDLLERVKSGNVQRQNQNPLHNLPPDRNGGSSSGTGNGGNGGSSSGTGNGGNGGSSSGASSRRGMPNWRPGSVRRGDSSDNA
jgi:hypothetical protein